MKNRYWLPILCGWYNPDGWLREQNAKPNGYMDNRNWEMNMKIHISNFKLMIVNGKDSEEAKETIKLKEGNIEVKLNNRLNEGKKIYHTLHMNQIKST